MGNLRFGWGLFRDLIDWTPATVTTYGQPQVKAEFLQLASDAVTTVSPAVTAHAGGGQGSAVLLTADYTNVSVTATAGDSVKLPTAVKGATYTVKNNGVANLAVFPNSSDTIDGGSANASITMAPGTTRLFTAISTVDWESTQAIVINGTVFTVTTGITAFATGGQASAVALTTYYNNITTSATAGDSVKLLTAAAGTVQVVTNSGATAIDVFPNTSDTINGGAANAAIRVAPGSTVEFLAIDGTDWKATSKILASSKGAVGAPAHTFYDQPDMGLYWVSSAQLGVAVSGALATLFDTSGIKSESIRNRVNLGTTPVGTVSITEYGDGKDITTVLTLTNFIVGALAGAAADLAVGNIVYAYPAGQHLELVYSLSSIVLTAAGTAVNTDTGLGSVIGSGVVSVLSGTATFEDRLTGQTIATAAGGGAAASALTAATAGIGTGIALNVAASVKNVFLNSAGSWNANNTGNLTATGTIILKWSLMS